MNRTAVYLFGYLVVIVGMVAALAKLDVLVRIGPAWTAIGAVIVLGIGIMGAVTLGGDRKVVEIDHV